MASTKTRANPWDRLDNESPPAWEAFVLYRDAGLTRSVAKIAEQCGKNASLLNRWSRAHSWVLRARAFDNETDRLHQATMREAHRKAQIRSVDLAEAMKNVGAGSLVAMVNDKTKLKASDVARFMEVAVRLEQAAFGTGVRHHGAGAPGGDGSKSASQEHVGLLSDEDRRARMRQLQRELAARLEDDEDDDD